MTNIKLVLGENYKDFMMTSCKYRAIFATKLPLMQHQNTEGMKTILGISYESDTYSMDKTSTINLQNLLDLNIPGIDPILAWNVCGVHFRIPLKSGQTPILICIFLPNCHFYPKLCHFDRPFRVKSIQSKWNSLIILSKFFKITARSQEWRPWIFTNHNTLKMIMSPQFSMVNLFFIFAARNWMDP